MERNRPQIKPRIHEWMALYSFIREKFVDGLQAKVNALRELQSQTGEELDALLPSVLDRAFKEEL